jgi:tripartite-type tricarboxylate transporter receptor subunit TctC
MFRFLATFTLGLLTTVAVHAQAWPSKTVTLVVPFPPGGSTDTVARAIGPKLQEKFGQTFVVDNKAGATGTIGAAQVKRAPADGYTFLVTSLGPLVIAPHLIKNVPYDAGKDFDFLTVAVQAPNVLVVPAGSPHKGVAEVIAFHKANPGKMTFASSGNGSSDHLTAELFWQQTGTSGTHVPYKGGAPAFSDLLGGQVDASFQNLGTVATQIKAGKIRPLAVTAKARSPQIPDVPTMAESGFPDLVVTSWQAAGAPAKTPREIVAKLNDAAVRALRSPEVRERLVAIGFDVVASTPDEFGAFMKAEVDRWTRVVDKGGIKPD